MLLSLRFGVDPSMSMDRYPLQSRFSPWYEWGNPGVSAGPPKAATVRIENLGWQRTVLVGLIR
ncbi:hypothetical protein AG1IA_00741 [Rhizoctonia solani AG-1 IA]|uniref:Uncharacterized protein n=1 Tax=Thanatephorus cucumeris (strain AG1-IA) TaxID=983506 RepID=L8X824_THACA|nr:hypothetical protein AG1IA_00741 [Rhizoctonia solani AG-1 IA]